MRGRGGKVRADLIWVFWLRRFDPVVRPFDNELDRWFAFEDGKRPDELNAAVIRMTFKYRARLIWLTRVQLVVTLYSLTVFIWKLIDGSLDLLSLAGMLVGFAGVVLSIRARASFTAYLVMGTWWSVGNPDFAKVLRYSGGEFKLGVMLRNSLRFVDEQSELGLTGNGYEIIRELAEQWELSFAELLETAMSLSK